MIPLIYVFNNRELRDAEEMALATIEGLRDEFQPFVFAPEGNVVTKARQLGFFAQSFDGNRELLFRLWLLMSAYREIAFVATEPAHSLSMNVLNTFYRRRLTHLHIVDGATYDAGSNSKNAGLGCKDVIFVTRSESIKERLVANGTRQERIRVIEGFLSDDKIRQLPRRKSFKKNGVRKVLVAAGDDAADKLALLERAVQKAQSLKGMEFIFAGTGNPVSVRGDFGLGDNLITISHTPDTLTSHLPQADLLLLIRPPETSDAAMLAAFAAGVPILTAADENGSNVISHNINGFSFRRDDADDLAANLERLSQVSFDHLNAVARGGRYLLDIRFSSEKGVERFRRLVSGQMTPAIEFSGGRLIL